jgi:hypothetical protein
MPLVYTRAYNSLPMLVSGYVNSLGSNWRSTYYANIVAANGTAYVYRPSGKAALFTLVNGVYQSAATNVVATL